MALDLLGGVLGGGGGGGGGGLAGGVLGGAIGSVGGVIGSIAQQRANRESFKDVRQGVQVGTAETARQTAAAMGSKEYQAYANFVRGMFGIGPVSGAEQRTQMLGTFGGTRIFGADVNGYGDSPYLKTTGQGGTLRVGGHSQAAFNQDYFNKMFGPSGDENFDTRTASSKYYSKFGTLPPGLTPVGSGPGAPAGGPAMEGGSPAGYGAWSDPFDPLAKEFSTKLGAAQNARGIYSSQAAASAEASGLAALRTNMQMQLLPQLLGLATMPTDLSNRYMDANMQRGVYDRTGGATTYGVTNPGLVANGGGALGAIAAGLQGGAAGFGAGSSVGLAYQNAASQANFNQQYLSQFRTNQLPIGGYMPPSYNGQVGGGFGAY